MKNLILRNLREDRVDFLGVLIQEDLLLLEVGYDFFREKLAGFLQNPW